MHFRSITFRYNHFTLNDAILVNAAAQGLRGHMGASENRLIEAVLREPFTVRDASFIPLVMKL